MFNVGGAELLVIMLLALVVLGPDKLPAAARQVGRVMGEIRRMSQGFQQELRSAMDVEAHVASTLGTDGPTLPPLPPTPATPPAETSPTADAAPAAETGPPEPDAAPQHGSPPSPPSPPSPTSPPTPATPAPAPLDGANLPHAESPPASFT